MPRELKKRGRREEQKRKARDVVNESTTKKPRRHGDVEEYPAQLSFANESEVDFIRLDDGSRGEKLGVDAQQEPQNQFYGMLDPDEQAYYANVNVKLNANDFESDEDRALFIDAVHRETEGKEMKLASSQSCSRYLEKIIMLSTSSQLQSLFRAFLEDLSYLVQHRFGSHCCEALFLESAAHVKNDNNSKDEDSFESLFIRATEQLKPNLGYLVTDRFATHTIRILVLVLSGEPLDESINKVVASRKKEKIDLPGHIDTKQHEHRKVPASFKKAQADMIAGALSSLDTTYVRALATHPTGNPFLQLILKLELTTSKGKEQKPQPLFQRLFPDEDFTEDSETAKFIQGLMYDPTGSHLIEVLIQSLPGKLFKKLYGNMLKGRMRNLAKNDIASYIAIRVLERLGKDDLAEARDLILPEVPGLVARSRLGLLKTLFDRGTIRQVDMKSLLSPIVYQYGDDIGTLLPKMLSFDTDIDSINTPGERTKTDSRGTDPHGSLLAQAILQNVSSRGAIEESFLAQPQSTLVAMAKNPVASRALQAALKGPSASIRFRRQAVPKFYGSIAELAQNAAGSHLIDALWDATSEAHFMKEKIAGELLKNETVLRESVYGRTVWRNWAIDMYQRRRSEWHALAKGIETEPSTQQEKSDTSGKTAIQLARERHARNKAKNGEPKRVNQTQLKAGA